MEQLTIEQLKAIVAFHKKLKHLSDKFDRDGRKFLGKFQYSKRKARSVADVGEHVCLEMMRVYSKHVGTTGNESISIINNT